MDSFSTTAIFELMGNTFDALRNVSTVLDSEIRHLV